jgi:hypothetical protein
MSDNFYIKFLAVMEGMPGFLFFRYKNNTMDVRVNNLKELMDVTQCDTLSVPLKCNVKACESIKLNFLICS